MISLCASPTSRILRFRRPSPVSSCLRRVLIPDKNRTVSVPYWCDDVVSMVLVRRKEEPRRQHPPQLTELKGRVKYTFASFWNRNHTIRALERAVKNFHATIEAEKKEIAEYLATRAQEVGRSTSVRSSFADAALVSGYPTFTRGKLDDATVIVSIVQRIN